MKIQEIRRRELVLTLVGLALSGCSKADPAISLKLTIGATTPAELESIILDDYPILRSRDGPLLYVSHRTTAHEARFLPARLRPAPEHIHAKWRYQVHPAPANPGQQAGEGPWHVAEQTVPLRAAMDPKAIERLVKEPDHHRLVLRLRFDHDQLRVVAEAERWH